MVLHADSDVACLTMPESRSYYAGHFYLSDWPSPCPILPNPERNGLIHTECKTILNVVSSVYEDEECVAAIGMQPALIALGQKQQATPLKMDNSTTERFVNSGWNQNVQKHGIWSCTGWDTKRYWRNLECIVTKEKNNDAGYFTKHNPPIHHHQMCPRYMHTSKLVRTIPQTIRLCEGVLNRVPGTQSRIESMKVVWAKPQSMTNKFHTVRRLKLPRQLIM